MCAYHYDVGRRGRSTRGARDRDRHRVRPVRLCERADDEHYEPNGTARLARCPARRRGAKHDCSERVGQQRRRERVERIVGLCRTVRASLHCALAEAAGGNGALGEWERRMGERRVYRTSIMRASREASRARSFSSAGGRASLSLCETLRRSAAWIVACGELRASRREVKRLGGRANRRL